MKKKMQFLSTILLLSLPLVAGGRAKGAAKPKAEHLGMTATNGAKAKAPAHPINLNSASMTELMQLPKVGAKTAERIVAWRKAHGGFRRPEELMHVKGIGEKGFQRLKPYLQASTQPASSLAVSKK